MPLRSKEARRSSVREANGAILASGLSSTDMLRCECGEETCSEALPVNLVEYSLALRRRGAFVAIAQHVDLKHDRKLMALGDSWLVGERFHVEAGDQFANARRARRGLVNRAG